MSLLPCPFCGSEPKIEQIGDEWLIVCTNRGECPASDDGLYLKDKQRTIDIWNTRIRKGGGG